MLRSFSGVRVCCCLIANSSSRNLYTSESLGLDYFQKFVQDRRAKIMCDSKTVWRKVDDYLSTESGRFIFSEDLKDAIALAHDDETLRKVTDLSLWYKKQKEKVGLSVYYFGPNLLRLHHKLRKPVEAFEVFTSTKFRMEFDFLGCYIILMDLLFESGEYEKVLQCWDYFNNTSNIKKLLPCPRSFQNLIFAACYKMGTEESFKIALSFLRYCQENRQSVHRRGIGFLVAHAIKLNLLEMGYEIWCLIPHPQNYLIGRTLGVFLSAKLGRLLDGLKILENLCLSDLPALDYEDKEITVESLEAMKKAVKSHGNEELVRKLDELERYLRQGGHLISLSIDALVSSPISFLPARFETLDRLDFDDEGKFLAPFELTEEKRNELGSKVYSAKTTDRRKISRSEAIVKERIVESVADHIRAEGPFEIDSEVEHVS